MLCGKSSLIAVCFWAAAVQASPAFINERQTGESNYLVNFTDTTLVVIPSKEMANAAVNIVLGKSNQPLRGWADRFFALAGLGRVSSEQQVNKTEKPETTTTEAVITELSSVSPSQKKRTTKQEQLTLIQTGLEECGPDGHRDSLGICVYDITTK